MALDVRTAPPESGEVVLGVTLPALLDAAVAQYPNARAFNQRRGGEWVAVSNSAFSDAADEVASGLLQLGLEAGDRAALFMNSDLDFVLSDFGTLIAGLVNVPLYVTFSRKNLIYALNHCEARVLIVSDPRLLGEAREWIQDVPSIEVVVLANGDLPEANWPDHLRPIGLAELRTIGRGRLVGDPGLRHRMRESVSPHDLATIIYTSGTTGRPKGVMLSHENITSNVYAAFGGIKILDHQREVALTFLPLTHIYARMLSFASVAWSHQIFYSSPEALPEDLPAVRPTVFATVPRLLEKVYDRVSLGIEQAPARRRAVGRWALARARRFEIGRTPSRLERAQLGIADRMVFSKIRQRLGLTRLKAISSGGAALRADLANTFAAMGIPVYQGYGLTESSPVITTAIPEHNRAGTVGPPIAGVEVAIADDGEILTRGPHVMLGYYKDEALTAKVIDADGWLRTGDIGQFTREGYLVITDRKKSLFKQSTGKYVSPQPVENRLTESPLIEQAVVVGENRPFTTALLFPAEDPLREWAARQGIEVGNSLSQLLGDIRIRREYESIVAAVNADLDPWDQVKRFRLVPALMDLENGLLTPTLKVRRSAVQHHFEKEIHQLYRATDLPSEGGPWAV